MTNYLLSAYPNAIRKEGGWTPGSYGGHDASVTNWPGAALRFKATTSSIGAFLFRDGRKIALCVDGVRTAVTTLPNDGAWADTALFTGLDAAAEHIYLVAVGSNGGQYLSYLTLGTLNTASLAQRAAFAAFGDSIVEGTAGTSGDASLCDAFQLALALNMACENRGIGGTTVWNNGSDAASGEARTADVTGISPAPVSVLVRYGLNDLGQVRGAETASQFQASYTAMLTSLTAGLPQTMFECESIISTGSGSYGDRAPWNAAIQASINAVNSLRGNAHCVYRNITGAAWPDYDGTTASGQTADGVHPTAAGYQILKAHEIAYFNGAPTITAPGNQSVVAGQSTGTLAVVLGDAEDAPAALTLSAVSSNSALVPNDAITLGGNGASRTVSIAASNLPPQTATITLTATDTAGAQTSASFVVTVNPNSANNLNAPMTFTNHNSTITAAHASQQILATNASRAFYFLQNCSVHPMYVGIGAAASKEGGAVQLRPGEHLDWSMLPTTQAIHVLSPNAGGVFTLLEA